MHGVNKWMGEDGSKDRAEHALYHLSTILLPLHVYVCLWPATLWWRAWNSEGSARYTRRSRSGSMRSRRAELNGAAPSEGRGQCERRQTVTAHSLYNKNIIIILCLCMCAYFLNHHHSASTHCSTPRPPGDPFPTATIITILKPPAIFSIYSYILEITLYCSKLYWRLESSI